MQPYLKPANLSPGFSIFSFSLSRFFFGTKFRAFEIGCARVCVLVVVVEVCVVYVKVYIHLRRVFSVRVNYYRIRFCVCCETEQTFIICCGKLNVNIWTWWFSGSPSPWRGTNRLCRWLIIFRAYKFGSSQIGFGTLIRGTGNSAVNHSQYTFTQSLMVSCSVSGNDNPWQMTPMHQFT